ncbi:hypothetical protein BUE81_24385, partial [Escherichia coli]
MIKIFIGHYINAFNSTVD